MAPVNLLALDNAFFETNPKRGQGQAPRAEGFCTAFGNLMQVPAAEGRRLPPGTDVLTGPVPAGEVLPPAGKGLPAGTPPSFDGELSDGELVASLAPENPVLPVPLAGDVQNPVGVPAPPLAAAIEAGLAASPAGEILPPAGDRVHEAAAEATAAMLHTATTGETGAVAGTVQPDVLQHLRYLKPGTDGRARLPAETDAGRNPAADLRLHAPAATPPVTAGLQEIAERVIDAGRAAAASTSVAADAMLRGEIQDLKAAPPAAPALPSLNSQAPTPANAASPQATPLQWTTAGIDVAPGQAGWDEALGDRVMWMAGNKIQSAELKLNPAELGPLRVHISMDDGNATVTFTAQHPVTRDAIEQALPRLREMLADQGLALQNASVNDHGSRREQAGAGGERAEPQFASGSPESSNSSRVDERNPSPAVRVPSGLVDVFA